jgi:ribosomal-protein-alanine N-acetyltransferase
VLPELETARLRLRQFEPSDVDAFALITRDAEVMRHIGHGEPISRQETADSLALIIEAARRRGFGKWALVEKTDGQFVGYCGLATGFVDVGVELAYMLARDRWGRGLVAEASRACLRYGFEELGLASIAALTKAGNARSRRVLERLGMSFVKNGLYHGYECVHYAIRREDFDAGGDFYRLTRPHQSPPPARLIC